MRNLFSLKKLLILSCIACASLTLQAQTIRTNYRSEGIMHISTDYEPLQLGSVSSLARVELVGFPDGSSLYLLYLNLVEKTATVVPKGVKMAFTLQNGKLVRAEQIGQPSATPRRMDDGNFLNRLKYAIEPADMEKLVRGIKSVDIVTGWNPDDFISADFPKNAFADLLLQHCQAILKASDNTIELQATMSGYTENTNTILSTSNPVVARGTNFDYNILLTHLYYKGTNEEDMDLAFVLGTNASYHIPVDSPVKLTLTDGSTIELLQARDDVNFVYLYPSMEDMYRMATLGISGLTIEYEGGVLADSFSPNEQKNGFSDAVNQELHSCLLIKNN